MGQRRVADGWHEGSPGWGAGTAAEGILKYTESQNVTAQYLLPIAPVAGMSQETYARVMTAALRAAQGRGARVTATRDYDVLVVGSGFGGSVDRPAAGREGVPRPRRRVRPPVPRRGLREDVVGPAQLPVGAAAQVLRRAARCTGSPTWWSSPGRASVAARSTTPTPCTCRRRRSSRDPQWGDITDWQAELAPHYDDRLDDARRGHQPVRGRRRGRHAADGRRPRGRRHVPQDTRPGCSTACPASGCPTPTSVVPAPTAPAAPSAATAWSAAGWAPRTPS